MKPRILLMVASMIILLHSIGHLFGMSGWTKAQTAEQKMVVHAMTDHYFPFMGAVHSFGDSFNGFGYLVEILLLLVAYFLWISGAIAARQPSSSRLISGALFIALLAQSVLEFIYFFPFAAILSSVATALTGMAFLYTKDGVLKSDLNKNQLVQ